MKFLKRLNFNDIPNSSFLMKFCFFIFNEKTPLAIAMQKRLVKIVTLLIRHKKNKKNDEI